MLIRPRRKPDAFLLFWAALLALLLALAFGGCSTAAPQIRKALPVPKVDTAIAQTKAIQQATARTDSALQRASAAIARAKVDADAATAAGTTVDAKLLGDIEEANAANEEAKRENKSAWATAATAQSGLEATSLALSKVETDYNLRIEQLNKANARVARLEEELAPMNDWWGFGAVWYGLKRLAWHLALVLLGLIAAAAALSFFFPPVAALVGRLIPSFIARGFAVVSGFFHGLFGRRTAS